MQAWQVHENGEPSEVMRLQDVERPTPGDGQVLLKVRAANINFPDVLMCRGHYQVRPPLPFTPGVEICGETEDGRRVLATPALPQGGFAEYVVADEAALLPAPDALDDAAHQQQPLVRGYRRQQRADGERGRARCEHVASAEQVCQASGQQ